MTRKSIFTRSYREMLARLKAARRAAGVHQDQVAKSLGLGQSAISKIERGERRIDPIELQQLAKLYRVTVSHLLGD